MVNWDDLKYLLATIQCGSYSLAASELGVNRTTVARRIAALEQSLGVVLLEQGSSGYQMTEAGEQALESARALAHQVSELEHRVSEQGDALSGSLRIAMPLGLGPEFMGAAGQFATLYPRVEMELINSVDPMASINQRKADVGIGLGHSLPDYLHGQALGELERAIYASRGYLAERPEDCDISQHRWIGWGREMAHTQVARWMQRHVSAQAQVPMRVNSWHALRRAVEQGLGVGHLWYFLAEPDHNLVRISDVIPELTITLWLFRHSEMTHNKRVNSFIEHMAPALVKLLASRSS